MKIGLDSVTRNVQLNLIQHHVIPHLCKSKQRNNISENILFCNKLLLYVYCLTNAKIAEHCHVLVQYYIVYNCTENIFKCIDLYSGQSDTFK